MRNDDSRLQKPWLARIPSLFGRLVLVGLAQTAVAGDAFQLPEPPKPKLYIAGDSTASNGKDSGWGSHLQTFFDSDQLTVVNRARGGRSSRTFVTEGHWEKIRRDLLPGDHVIIQFGHNDAGRINDPKKARGSLPGLGDETREIDNQATGKHEAVHTFGWYLRKMIGETRTAGATPIVFTMTARDVWPDGRIERKNKFCSFAREVAGQTDAAFVDLRTIIADQYELLGPIRVRELFPIDHTHTGPDGARINAALVVSGLKEMDSPLATWVSPEGRRVAPYGMNMLVKEVRDFMTSTWMPDAQPESDPSLPTLHVIGDSTVRNGTRGNGSNGEWGWGAPLGDFFDRSRVNVENHAWGGTSSRTFRTSGRWQPVRDALRPGDVVLLQFGHNDSSSLNDRHRARGTIRGTGEETEEIDNLLTGRHETVHTYGWYIRQYVSEVQARGATPIVCSPVPRNRWTNGKVDRSEDSYPRWAAQAAQQSKAPCIDLNQRVCDLYDSMGQARVEALCFGDGEKTHTQAWGAQINATCVISGIRSLDGLALSGYLKNLEAH